MSRDRASSRGVTCEPRLDPVQFPHSRNEPPRSRPGGGRVRWNTLRIRRFWIRLGEKRARSAERARPCDHQPTEDAPCAWPDGRIRRLGARDEQQNCVTNRDRSGASATVSATAAYGDDVQATVIRTPMRRDGAPAARSSAWPAKGDDRKSEPRRAPQQPNTSVRNKNTIYRERRRQHADSRSMRTQEFQRAGGVHSWS